MTTAQQDEILPIFWKVSADLAALKMKAESMGCLRVAMICETSNAPIQELLNEITGKEK